MRLWRNSQRNEKYKDISALADGFHIFLPNVPQPEDHFTSVSQ